MIAPEPPPPVAPDIGVVREGALAELDRIAVRTVSVVCAPAGSGKTTLLRQWMRARAPLAVTWIDARHPDSLRDAVSAAPGRVVVVDGIDSVALADAGLELARRFLAARDAHLVLCGRCPPPPGLVPLSLGGQVWQLDPTALEVAPDELEPIMRAHGQRPFTVSDPAATMARLDGWMVAAVLTAMHRTSGDDTSVREAIDGYVESDVLRDLEPDLRDFVLDTAHAAELDPSLCDAITGARDSERKIDDLRRAGFPIVHASSATYRLIHPVREVLDRLARRRDPDRQAAGLRAAAGWYDGHGMPFEAAACLARVDAWDEIVPTVLNHLAQILERDEIGRLAELIRNAPDHVLRRQAALALGGSWVLRMDGRVSAAVQLLNVYEPHMDDRARMIADVGRASVASWTDDMAAADAFADKAVTACDALGDDAFAVGVYPRLLPLSFGADSTDIYRTFAHGAGLLACAYGGMWEHAVDHMVDIAADTYMRMPQVRVVEQRGIRATFHALSGQAVEAEREATAALTGARETDLHDNRASADAFFALGEAARVQLRHDDASTALERALVLAELNDRRNLIATITAARVHLAIDGRQPARAHRLLDEFRDRYAQRFPPTIAGFLAAAEARLLIGVGRYQAAFRALEAAPLTPHTASARVGSLIGAGDIAGAQRTVSDWPTSPTVDSTVRRALAAAVICDHTGDHRRSTLLRTAFDAARPHQLIQPFTEHGPKHARLLRAAIKVDAAFSDAIRQWLARDAIQTDVPRLTARETTIMSHLADGRTLPEVAAAVHLSLNTVRTHTRTAYRKLGVTNRADAARAWRRRTSTSASDPT